MEVLDKFEAAYCLSHEHILLPTVHATTTEHPLYLYNLDMAGKKGNKLVYALLPETHPQGQLRVLASTL